MEIPKKRLTKRNRNGKAMYNIGYKLLKKEEPRYKQKCIERLCEYEDALDKGQLIILPVGINEMLYRVILDLEKPIYKVEAIKVLSVHSAGASGWEFGCIIPGEVIPFSTFLPQIYMERSVFTDKAKAEEAARKLNIEGTIHGWKKEKAMRNGKHITK